MSDRHGIRQDLRMDYVPYAESQSARAVWRPNPGFQVNFMTSPIFEVMACGPRGNGKALPMDAKVLTPWGFKTMAEMHVGSQICAPDGTTSRVIGVYDQGERPVFKVNFKDGRCVRADDEHLWLFREAGGHVEVPATTNQLVSWLQKGATFYIPVSEEKQIDGEFVGSGYWPDMHGNENPVQAIEPDGIEHTRCIKIDHPTGLFITDDFVVTHNTDCLLMDFAQDVGRGHGRHWRGVLFRRTYPELGDVIEKSKRWFPLMFPGANYNEQKSEWRFKTGEALLFRHLKSMTDYWSYHGHEYPWVGFEELTSWSSPQVFVAMISCVRSAIIGIPRRLRATTNPYGPGMGWIKHRYRLPTMLNHIVVTEDEPLRIALHGDLEENIPLLAATPNYQMQTSAAAPNAAAREAWKTGSWDVVVGGIFDDVWSSEHHIIPSFVVPRTWRVDRSFDWGASRPFSIGWWAESDGTDLELPGGVIMPTVRGDLFRIAEWYGCTGIPNEGLRLTPGEIARGIVEREKELPLDAFTKVRPGPADSSIFNNDPGVQSVAKQMKDEGVKWTPANKSPGTRKAGWQKLRAMLKAALPPDHPAHAGACPRSPGQPRELPALFITNNCHAFARTVPTLSCDDDDPDDVNTDTEDHIADDTRYRILNPKRRVQQTSFRS